jgi:hypothetical protein
MCPIQAGSRKERDQLDKPNKLNKPNEPNKPIKLNKPNEHQETAISFESPQRLIKQIAWPDPGSS